MVNILAPLTLKCSARNCDDCEHLNTRGTFCELLEEDVEKDDNDGNSIRCNGCLKAEKLYKKFNKFTP